MFSVFFGYSSKALRLNGFIMWFFVRRCSPFLCVAFSLIHALFSFASATESADDWSLFDNNSGSPSLFEEDTELAFEPLRISDDTTPSLFDDKFTSDLFNDEFTSGLFSDESNLGLRLGEVDSSASITSTDFDQNWLADADPEFKCISLTDQFISKRRRADNICTPDTTPMDQEPSKNTDPPSQIPGSDAQFPPPGSNPGRHNDQPENDPSPRPAKYRPNTNFDFQYCPSGLLGYRMYAVCDSGSEQDRYYNRISDLTTLVYCTPRMFPAALPGSHR